MLKKKLPIFRVVREEQRKQLRSRGLELKPRKGGEWLVLKGFHWRVVYADSGMMDSYELWRRGKYIGHVFTLGSTSSFVRLR
jgi:hypothetical protein